MKLFLVLVGSLIAAPFVVGMSLVLAAGNGFVLERLWVWYAVPLGAHAIGWRAFAIAGASLALIRPPVQAPENNKPRDEKIAAFFGMLIAPWFVLLVGWILK